MALQCDIIPATGTDYFTTNIEDGMALADAETRAALQRDFPEAWSRIARRRTFMTDVLGIRLKPEVLPFSSIPAWLPPFWLDPGKAMAMRRWPASVLRPPPPCRELTTWSAARPVSSAMWSKCIGEGANTGGGRTQLDDQRAHFRLGHMRPDRVPARPAVAGVKTQKLAAMAGDDLVDPRRRIARHMDLDRHDRVPAAPASIAACPRSWRCAPPS